MEGGYLILLAPLVIWLVGIFLGGLSLESLDLIFQLIQSTEIDGKCMDQVLCALSEACPTMPLCFFVQLAFFSFILFRARNYKIERFVCLALSLLFGLVHAWQWHLLHEAKARIAKRVTVIITIVKVEDNNGVTSQIHFLSWIMG